MKTKKKTMKKLPLNWTVIQLWEIIRRNPRYKEDYNKFNKISKTTKSNTDACALEFQLKWGIYPSDPCNRDLHFLPYLIDWQFNRYLIPVYPDTRAEEVEDTFKKIRKISERKNGMTSTRRSGEKELRRYLGIWDCWNKGMKYRQIENIYFKRSTEEKRHNGVNKAIRAIKTLQYKISQMLLHSSDFIYKRKYF